MWNPNAFSMDTFGTATDRKLGGPSYLNMFHPQFPDMPPAPGDRYMVSGYFGHGLPPELARNRQFDPDIGRMEFERSGMPPPMLWDPAREHWARHMKRMAYGDGWEQQLERERHGGLWDKLAEQPSPHASVDYEYMRKLDEFQKKDQRKEFQPARSKSYEEALDRFTWEGGRPEEDRQGDVHEESQEESKEAETRKFTPQWNLRGTDFGYGFHDTRGTARNTWRNFGKKGYDLPYYAGWWRPRADIMEEGGNIRVDLELPGVPKDNIQLIVADDFIEISTIKPLSRKEESSYFYQNERHFGNFYRKLWLPKLIDPTTSSAILEKGVLKITCHAAVGGIGSREIRTTEGTGVGKGGVQGFMRVREENQDSGIRNPKTAATPSTGTTRLREQQQQTPSTRLDEVPLSQGDKTKQATAVARDSAGVGDFRPHSSLVSSVPARTVNK